MPLPIIAWVCYTCIAAGATYCVHKVASSYNKNTKNKKRKLELKGKSIEQAREENKRLNSRNQELEDKLKQGENQEKEVEKQISDTKKELDDPNISKKREEELRGKLGFLQTQLDDLKKNNRSYRDEIKKNNKQMEDNTNSANKATSNLDDRHWIWEFLTLENIMIMGACYALYQLMKEEKRER